MLRKIIALLLCAALLCAVALAEADAPGNAMPAEDQPLKNRVAERVDEAAADTPIENAPYVPDALDRVVVGADDRVTVSNPNYYPYSAIAYMIVHARCGCDWSGSGFMVSPKGLVTASHCLVCTTHHQTADQITLYFGYSSNRNYFYKYDGPTTYWYGDDFTSNGYDSEWDYGYVLLNERVGDRTGWFGVSVQNDYDIASKYLTVAGYRDGVLKYDYDFVDIVNANLIRYTADTQPGNSGGPVFFYGDNDIFATAINVSESISEQRNYARRINSALFYDMQANGLFD
ncbi:MAG: trypsin-like peptidase domain-containing protein [Clostridia bacterium]|nr:trypsin-like peptidase domain-containing protein [Clostridia bacterium]